MEPVYAFLSDRFPALCEDFDVKGLRSKLGLLLLQAMAATHHLTELLLSSTDASSPLPTTSLHSLQTGSLVFGFKTPNASTASAANSNSATDKDAPTLQHRKTMGVVQSTNGSGGIVLGLGGKDGRSGVNVWGFQKVRFALRLCQLHCAARMARGGLASEKKIADEWNFGLIGVAGTSSAAFDSACALVDHLRLAYGRLPRWRNSGRSHFLLGGERMVFVHLPVVTES